MRLPPPAPWLKSRYRGFQCAQKAMFTRVNIFRNRINGEGNESRNEHLPGYRKESSMLGSDEAVQINSRSVTWTSGIFLQRPIAKQNALCC